MKKTLIGLGAMLLVAGSIGVAGALPLTDTTLFTESGTSATEDYVSHGRGTVDFLSTSALEALFFNFDYVSWNHLFQFVPAAQTINSAVLTIWLSDDEKDKNLRSKEWGFGYTEGGNWDFGEVDSGFEKYKVNVTSLYDGKFSVTVASLAGDFYIKKSELSIDYTPAPAPVPEPATLLLMGTGLAGLIAARRRKSKMA